LPYTPAQQLRKSAQESGNNFPEQLAQPIENQQKSLLSAVFKKNHFTGAQFIKCLTANEAISGSLAHPQPVKKPKATTGFYLFLPALSG
jgi:hypothetical protein